MKKIETLIAIKLAFLFVVFCNAFVDVAHKILLQNIVFKVLDGPSQVAFNNKPSNYNSFFTSFYF